LLANEQGRLLLDESRGLYSPTWAALCVTAAGDSALAWELIQYAIRAYVEPVGRATGQFGMNFGRHNLASPIQRDLFTAHYRRAFENIASYESDLMGASNPTEMNRQINNAINRISAYNEMEMALISPMIPRDLLHNDISPFIQGLITAQEAANRLHNTISLWLIE
jgi:hypothetical protein